MEYLSVILSRHSIFNNVKKIDYGYTVYYKVTQFLMYFFSLYLFLIEQGTLITIHILNL